MSEWLKERAWKARVGVIPLPWVRIPLSPPISEEFARNLVKGWTLLKEFPHKPQTVAFIYTLQIHKKSGPAEPSDI